MTLQVVNLGLPRSGTTTLARALHHAGYKVADHRLRDPAPCPARAHLCERPLFVADLLYRGYFGTGDPGALLPDYTAIAEMNMLRGGRSLWPQADFGLLLALRAHHPGLRFVATRRPPEAIAASMLRWNNLGQTRLPARDVPGLPAGYGRNAGELARWIGAHHAALDHWFRDDPAFLALPVAAPDAQDRLTRFLRRPVPWWGRANTSPPVATAAE
jgi:hypothetical protein